MLLLREPSALTSPERKAFLSSGITGVSSSLRWSRAEQATGLRLIYVGAAACLLVLQSTVVIAAFLA